MISSRKLSWLSLKLGDKILTNNHSSSRCIQDEALQCSNKPGRAMHLAKTIIRLLHVFKSIALNYFGEVMPREYFSRSSKILTTYVDMELKGSVKARIDHASIANQIATNIDSHLTVKSRMVDPNDFY
jgi:hypothetical protein